MDFNRFIKKSFIITIDTEGDNLWAVSDIHQKITTENAGYLFRFQELCEKFGFIPTYLTNYEMACDEAMVELGRDGLKKGTLEIGAHEHAWNSPPYYPLIKRLGHRGKPYLGEYPSHVIRKKLEYLTHTLEDTFQCSITSHRGGRWCLNSTIICELDKLGYRVDCTCTPGVSWKTDRGYTIGAGGTDWSQYDNAVFRLKYIRNGDEVESNLLEVPVTIEDMKHNGHYSWLRPNLGNKKEMLALLKYMDEKDCSHVEFMLHSSELMPGGSPIFSNKGKIEYLYRDLTDVFQYASELGFTGAGITDYAINNNLEVKV